MENNVLDDHLKSGSAEAGLTIEGLEYLRQSGKWGKFLAIIGFIGCALIVLVGLFFGTLMSTVSSLSNSPVPMGAVSGFVGVIYIVIAALFFFPAFTFTVSQQMQLPLQPQRAASR